MSLYPRDVVTGASIRLKMPSARIRVSIHAMWLRVPAYFADSSGQGARVSIHAMWLRVPA